MAKSKTAMDSSSAVVLDEVPALAESPIEAPPSGGSPISTSAADFDLQKIAKGGAEVNVGQIDLSGIDEDDGDLDGIFSSLTPESWVLAKYTGANGSPYSEHVQRVGNHKATFPLDKWVVCQYFFVLAARDSGYVDFVHNKGGKHMRKAMNQPTIQIQDVIPAEMQSSDRIMEFIEFVKEKRGRVLPLACKSFS